MQYILCSCSQITRKSTGNAETEDLSWPEEAVEPRMCQGPLLNLYVSFPLHKEAEAGNFQVMEEIADGAQRANEEQSTLCKVRDMHKVLFSNLSADPSRILRERAGEECFGDRQTDGRTDMLRVF